MAVSLSKGGKVSLSKEVAMLGIPKLSKVAVGLGWDVSSGYDDMDLDAWALAITDDRNQHGNLVYFGNRRDTSRVIYHHGDNLTGAGDGDDEVISIDLSQAPSSYKHILVGVTIYSAQSRHQSFKDVKNGFIRVYDENSGIEICKYSDKFRDDNMSRTVTMLFGIFTRVGNE